MLVMGDVVDPSTICRSYPSQIRRALTIVNFTGRAGQAPVRWFPPTGPRLRDLHAAPTGGVNMAQRAKSEEKLLMADIDNPITATAF